MRWHKVESRIYELETKQAELLEEYNGIAELISEDLEEHDLESFRMHVADIEPLLQDLSAIRAELNYIGDVVDDAVDDELMRRAGME